MKKNNTIIWASDLSPSTGEGILAQKFLKFILQKIKGPVQIKSFENTYIFKKNNYLKKRTPVYKNFFHKYFGPIYGAYYLWLNRDKNIIYINYLPLWNFIIFLFLPKKTIIGPITGGIYNNQVTNFNSLIRKYIFPLFFKISIFIIYRKFKKIIFSTNLLKSYIPKSKYNSTLFNFVFSFFNLQFDKRIKEKQFDIIFYNRNHQTKTSKSRNDIINFFSKYYKICVVGDFYNNSNVKNFGFINRKKIYNLFKKCEIALASEENFFSLFVIDAINCNSKIVSLYECAPKSFSQKNFFFIKQNKNYSLIRKKLKKILKIKFEHDKNFKNNIYNNQKKINNFFKDLI